MTAEQGDTLIDSLGYVGVALFAETMRDAGVCLPDDECAPWWTVPYAGMAMLSDDPPRWLVRSDYTGDPVLAAGAVLAHPRYLRLKARSEREVSGCHRPDTCRHGIVRRALLAVEREYFAPLEGRS